ncbi:histidinol-phosphate aminotransferase family protein [Puniceicoccaceae bacterium K14]|nr:histidinol-phosphate aminotransferase family protein [Puniceicoccaceae bacterium K14]
MTKANTGITRRDWIRRSTLAAVGATLLPTFPKGFSQNVSNIAPVHPELKFINLAGNENPFGPSRNVSLAIMKEVSNSCRYPFREEKILKEMIARKEGVQPENIVLGNGCDELLSAAGRIYGKEGSNIVATKPTYLQLMEKAEHQGATVNWIPHTAEMKHDLESMQEAIDSNTSLVYICNPDTPTGTMRSFESIKSFCETAGKKTTVFLDEVYLEFLENFENETQVNLVREGLPIIIGRSFSKMHGLAGHRIGYTIAPKEISESLEHEKNSSLNYLGVIAATASLRDSEFHKLSVRKITEGRNKFCGLLQELNLSYTPSHGNFVFHYTGIPIEAFQKKMKERNFLVGRPFPPYDLWCRISIGSPKEMELYSSAMLQVFKGKRG